MQFNQYFWELYKQSEKGKEIISLFEERNHKGIASFLSTETFKSGISEDELNEYKGSRYKVWIVGENEIDVSLPFIELFKSFDFKFPRKTFEKIIDNDVYLSMLDAKIPKNSFEDLLFHIDLISISLFQVESNFFVPYTYRLKFNILQSIFEYFEIPLPKIPIKKDWRGRLLYYIDLCEALLEFRKHNELTRGELCAFLYDFAPATIEKTESKDMPKPSKAWFCGGNKLGFSFLDNAAHDSESVWQGNVDTRKGDIIVMYCLSPRSYIHSIWRADCDGFIDPFFHYYTMIYISHPEIVKPISQKELNGNPIISKSPLIRSNMQGLVGYPIKFEEYNEMLRILQNKGQNTATLPMIEPDFVLNDLELFNERDVEVKLIEPFLQKLGYSENDWVRQMPVKMGRGERNYPDYCFGANTKKGEESAKMILEAKFSVRNTKELHDDYFQTKSYALRLQATKFVIASKEGIWIYEPDKNQFEINSFSSYTWLQIEHPDIMHEVMKKIGSKQIM